MPSSYSSASGTDDMAPKKSYRTGVAWSIHPPPARWAGWPRGSRPTAPVQNRLQRFL